MKKKIVLSIIWFFIGFISIYLLLCYLPQLRLKLAAEPKVFFIESIKHNALNKAILSFVAGAVLAILPHIKKKR